MGALWDVWRKPFTRSSFLGSKDYRRKNQSMPDGLTSYNLLCDCGGSVPEFKKIQFAMFENNDF